MLGIPYLIMVGLEGVWWGGRQRGLSVVDNYMYMYEDSGWLYTLINAHGPL